MKSIPGTLSALLAALPLLSTSPVSGHARPLTFLDARSPTGAGSIPPAIRADASSSSPSSSAAAGGSGGNTEPTCASSTSNATVTTPGLYGEAYRPQVHFSQTTSFSNDPNGLVYNGTHWLIYYQLNPTGLMAGNQHWGHAVSTNLYDFRNYPPAIAPDVEGEDFVYSGSNVVDVNNTSGFFSDSDPPQQRLVALYTRATETTQVQNVAWSVGGQTYQKYRGNPVVSLPGEAQFRDPKVFWHEPTRSWVMAVALSQQFAVQFWTSPNLREWTRRGEFAQAGVRGYQYECPDLVRLRHRGGPREGEVAHVLVVSINPGAPLGGSFVQYWIGDFDGETFTAKDAVMRSADFGKDYYAPQSFYNAIDERVIAFGWASNWQYSQYVPTTPWRSQFSLPREMTLRWTQVTPELWDYALFMEPVDTSPVVDRVLFNQTAAAATATQAPSNASVATTTTSSDATPPPSSTPSANPTPFASSTLSNRSVALEGGGAFDIEATFVMPRNVSVPADMRAGYLTIHASVASSPAASGNASTSMAASAGRAGPAAAAVMAANATREVGALRTFVDFREEPTVVGLDRSGANGDWARANPYFTDKLSATLSGGWRVANDSSSDYLVRLRLVVDRSLTELYAGDAVDQGKVVGTALTYWPQEAVPSRLEVSTLSDVVRVESLRVTSLRSVWGGYENCA